MRLFVSEYVTSGALSTAELPRSLLREGTAMRDAVLQDLSLLGDVQVVTTSDPRCPASGVAALLVHHPAEELRAFERLAAECDAVLVIAPELDGVLLERCRMAAELSPQPLNCLPAAVELCGDKLALWRHLQAVGVPAIKTSSADETEWTGPCVLKPRCGAGSQQTSLCRTPAEYRARLGDFNCRRPESRPIVQPFVAGRSLSMAAVFDHQDGRLLQLWPPAEQRLSADGCFAYLGGELPAADCNPAPLQELVRQAAAAVPGLRGYVGFDLLWPDAPSGQPLLVEINPRLTTSYVGYRRLARHNPAAQLLGRHGAALEWRTGQIAYTAAGVIIEHDRHVGCEESDSTDGGTST